jgi:RNA polymerase sigma factor (TIGR02999 family)
MNDAPQNWDGRGHFFSAAAEAMRRILIEHARRRQSEKRGGGRQRVSLDDDLPEISSPCDEIDDLLSLDDALTRLTAQDPALGELVKLCTFGGLSLEEAAANLGISRATAYRRWAFARAYLHDAIKAGEQ